MTQDLNRRAIVTGASSGIGYATALELVNDGWTVLAVARRADRLEKLVAQAGDRIVALPLDLTEPDAPSRIMATAAQRLGGLDLLVNNAGTSWIGSFCDMPDEKMDEVIDLNVGALMRLTRRAIPLLEASSRAQIINIASVAAHLPMETIAVYCATKAAVVMFTRVLAKELGPKRIRVNALSPAGTATELFEKLGSPLDTSGFIAPSKQARMVVALTKLPMGIDVVEVVADQRFNVAV